ASNMMSAR
ncbi:hypothetical protein VCHENC02_3315B, partial [Vibrio harveyi]